MADVDVLLPEPAAVEALELLTSLSEAQRTVQPFASETMDFVGDLSSRLRRDRRVQESPAIAALAFWIRPASLRRLQSDFETLTAATPDVVRVPQGTIFHLPPTNVDTLFVYSWLLAALTGNANVIRLSPNAVDGTALLLGHIGQTLADHPAARDTTAIVSYGHDAEITGELSRADVRVIWGGDDTVAAIRAIPAAPWTADLCFPDRYSFAVIDADQVIALDEAGLSDLTHRFFNDAFWFDQLGCASPRLIVWFGSDESAHRASQTFRNSLRQQVDTRDAQPPGASAVLAKLVHAADTAAGGSVRAIDWSHGSVTVAELRSLDNLLRDSPGGGLFYETTVDRLDAVAPFVTRKDQTLVHFGLADDQVKALAAAVGSRGIDRLVPVGEALTFGRFWDGHDLLSEFTRATFVHR